MSELPQFNLSEIDTSLRSSTGSWANKYEDQATALKAVTFGSPFSLLSRTFDVTLNKTTGVELMTAGNNNAFFYIPTMIAFHYNQGTLGDGDNGVRVYAASNETQNGDSLMIQINFGNTIGNTSSRRWSADDGDTIYGCLHRSSIAGTAQSPGTWPVTPIDWVNRDSGNIHSEAQKAYPHQVLRNNLDDVDFENESGVARQNVYARLTSGSSASSFVIKQIDLYGMAFEKPICEGFCN